MFGFGKRAIDYDALGLELLQKAAEYQGPTVDGLYAYLEGSDQLQLSNEMAEKKLINAAAAVVVAEQYARGLESDFGPGAREHCHMILDGFYGYVAKLIGMNRPEAVGRIPPARAYVVKALIDAEHRFPARQQQSDDATHERLTYELARIVLSLHGLLASDKAPAELPTAFKDWKELAQATSGIGRAQRWVDTSVGPKLRKMLAN